MKILTAEEMRAVDRATIEQGGISSVELMMEAGRAVARFVSREFAGCRKIVVICGMGNNGGDGLVAAGELLKEGRAALEVILLGRTGELKGDPAAVLTRYGKMPLIHEVTEVAEVHTGGVARAIAEADLFVDAMVGTGFKPPLHGLGAIVRERLQPMETPIVAVDLPSGWDADSREYRVDGALRADAVVTFTAAKIAHVCGNLTGSAVKPIVVAPIGSPDELILSNTGLQWAGAAKKLTEAPREADDNKGQHGHVLVLGGAHGKAGAPSMASLAAMRAGAGLVTAAIPESILNTVARIAPELMTAPLAEGERGEIAASNLQPATLGALLEKKTVLAVGPGLGQEPGAEQLVLTLLDREPGSGGAQPMVLDADALNILSRHMDRLARRSKEDAQRRPLVLTPHPGEMARLAGLSIAQVQARREPLAREFAERYQVTLVLKGWRTLIAHPDGSVAVNTTGNPGLAKGGSGDMLTGVVAAMLAQYAHRPVSRELDALRLGQAVKAAVYLHGLAADFAVREQDEHTLLVTDVIASLWKAFRYRARDKAGYVWYQGLPTT